MSELTKEWARSARPIAELAMEHPLLGLSDASWTRKRSYDRLQLRFSASARRPFAGTLDLRGVYAILVDEGGGVVARRSSDYARATFVRDRATWTHELYDGQVGAATAIVYELELVARATRPLFEGELGPFPLEADDYARVELRPRAPVADALVELDLVPMLRRDMLELTIAATSRMSHDGHANALEIDLVDDRGAAVWGRSVSVSCSSNDPPTVTDLSIQLDRHALDVIRGLVVRGHTEVQTWLRLPPIRLGP